MVLGCIMVVLGYTHLYSTVLDNGRLSYKVELSVDKMATQLQELKQKVERLEVELKSVEAENKKVEAEKKKVEAEKKKVEVEKKKVEVESAEERKKLIKRVNEAEKTKVSLELH